MPAKKSIEGRAKTKADDQEKQAAGMPLKTVESPSEPITETSVSENGLQPLPALGRYLNRATRLINMVAEGELDAYDLTLPQWVVLTALWRADGMMVTHLAHYCANGQPALSRILDRMESKGLVVRRSAPRDRRSIRVFLTSEGQALSHLLNRYQLFNDIMMQDLNDQERAMLFSLLERIVANGEHHVANHSSNLE